MKKLFKKKKSLVAALLLVLILFTVIGAGIWYFYPKPKPQPKAPEKPVQVEEPKPTCNYKNQDVLTEINKVRSVPVVEDPRLSQIAQERVNEMNGVSDNHTGFKSRFYNSVLPYGYVYLGENIAQEVGCPNAVITVGGWMNSKLGHRETMLDVRYDFIGIAEYKGVVVTEYGDK